MKEAAIMENVDYRTMVKNDWVNQVILSLGYPEEKRSELEKVFEDTYKPSNLRLKNSFIHKEKLIPSDKFFYDIKKKAILNENGVLTYRTDIKKSPLADVMDAGIELRQVLKRAKNEKLKAGEVIEAAALGNQELTFKTVINGAYGLFGYPASYFYNIDLADTITTAGRNIVSVAAITIELLGGGYRYYEMTPYLTMIKIAESEKDLAKEYGLKEVDSDTCLQHLLKHYYSNYYAKSYLKSKIDEMDPLSRSVLYYKNNFTEFMKIPKIYQKIKSFIENLNGSHFIVKEKIGQEGDDGINETCVSILKELSSDIIKLVFGMYSFSGDYLNGVYRPTLVDIISNLKRKSVVNMDTDSSIPSVMREVFLFRELFKDSLSIFKDEDSYKVNEISIPMLITQLFRSLIKRSLWDYTSKIGVIEELRP